MLQGPGDAVITQVASGPLCDLTDSLMAQYGSGRVLDARRPRMDVDTPAVRPQPGYGFLSLLTTLLGTGVLVGID